MGDGQRASRATRACLAGQGDVALCPLPQGPLAEGVWDAALEAVWLGAPALSPVFWEAQDGQGERLAEGSERQVAMRLAVEGHLQPWVERRLGVRSVRQAPAAEQALRPRVANAMAQIEAGHQRGRGQQRCAEVAAFRPAGVALVPRERGEEF